MINFEETVDMTKNDEIDGAGANRVPIPARLCHSIVSDIRNTCHIIVSDIRYTRHIIVSDIR